MDILYLTEHEKIVDADYTGSSSVELLRELQDTLNRLRGALHFALMASRSGRKEARQWLINSIAALDIQDPGTRRRRFAQYLPQGGACRGAEHRPVGQAMLQLLFEAAPGEVGALLAQDAALLRRFFQSDPKRAPLWFGHFSMEGMRRFRFGASALAQYSLANRGEVWHLLSWRGRHSQAPVAVAQRPHYFCELDVPRTLRHLIRDCPDFWSSREMRDSVAASPAQLLGLDPGWWSKELLPWLEERRGEPGQRLRAALCRCLEAGPWRQHCQRLLQLLPQQDLLAFAEGLLDSSSLPSREGGRVAEAAAAPGAWLVFRGARWQSLEQLALASALGCSLPLLLRLLRDEEMEEERQEVASLVGRLLRAELPAEQRRPVVAAHWQLRKLLLQQRGEAAQEELRMLLLLHLFAAAFTVQQHSSSSRREAEQLQEVLAASGIECVLVSAGFELQNWDSHHRRRSAKGKKRRQKHGKSSSKKKRRRRHGSSSSESDREGSSSRSDGSCRDGTPDLFVELGAEGAAAGDSSRLAPQLHWRWRLKGSGAGSLDSGWQKGSGLELLDFVTQTVGAAYTDWLLGCQRHAGSR